MTIQQTIQSKLENEFKPLFCDVINESHMHNVPAGSESHFKIVLAATAFEGQSLVTRHKLIYKLLADELQTGVHALALHIYTPEEYENKHGKVPDSPLCLGGKAKS